MVLGYTSPPIFCTWITCGQAGWARRGGGGPGGAGDGGCGEGGWSSGAGGCGGDGEGEGGGCGGGGRAGGGHVVGPNSRYPPHWLPAENPARVDEALQVLRPMAARMSWASTGLSRLVYLRGYWGAGNMRARILMSGTGTGS